jgi:hypothetical protein
MSLVEIDDEFHKVLNKRTSEIGASKSQLSYMKWAPAFSSPKK